MFRTCETPILSPRGEGKSLPRGKGFRDGVT